VLIDTRVLQLATIIAAMEGVNLTNNCCTYRGGMNSSQQTSLQNRYSSSSNNNEYCYQDFANARPVEAEIIPVTNNRSGKSSSDLFFPQKLHLLLTAAETERSKFLRLIGSSLKSAMTSYYAVILSRGCFTWLSLSTAIMNHTITLTLLCEDLYITHYLTPLRGALLAQRHYLQMVAEVVKRW